MAVGGCQSQRQGRHANVVQLVDGYPARTHNIHCQTDCRCQDHETRINHMWPTSALIGTPVLMQDPWTTMPEAHPQPSHHCMIALQFYATRLCGYMAHSKRSRTSIWYTMATPPPAQPQPRCGRVSLPAPVLGPPTMCCCQQVPDVAPADAPARPPAAAACPSPALPASSSAPSPVDA